MCESFIFIVIYAQSSRITISLPDPSALSVLRYVSEC